MRREERFFILTVAALSGILIGVTLQQSYVQASSVSPGGVQTTVADGPQRDAFARQRSSNPVSIFDSQFQYGTLPLIWESILTGTGTATAAPASSSITLTVSASGDDVIRQSHRYLRYQPGKSQLIAMTGILGAIKANTTQQIGYFDASNGVFFEQNGTALEVVQRSSTSGSVVDTAVVQSNWNIDKLNGTGPSGITLDMTKAQIFIIDLQWLGVGRVRFGFDINGQIYYCHQMLNGNALSTVYMTTANLPARYELAMTGSTTATSMTQICQAVVAEGGVDEQRGLLFTANTGAANRTVSTSAFPLVSIRPQLTYAGVTNRGLVEPLNVQAYCSADALIQVVYDTTLTGASFSNVDTNSITQADKSATAISGGTVLLSYYVSGTGGGTNSNTNALTLGPLLGQLVALTLNGAGNVPDVLTVVATSFTGGITCTAAINWKEIY